MQLVGDSSVCASSNQRCKVQLVSNIYITQEVLTMEAVKQQVTIS